MSNTAQNNTAQNNGESSAVNVRWSYSGKAMRAQALLFVLISLLLVGGGLYATLTERLGTHYLAAWCVMAGALLLLWGYHYTLYFYRVYTLRYQLSDRHLYSFHGLLTQVSDSMELVLIDDAQLVQTLFDRIFNGGVGTITLFCASDKTDDKLVISGIDKPKEIFEKINSLRTTLRANRSILTAGN